MGRAEQVPRRRVCKTNLPATGSPAGRRQEVLVNLLKNIWLRVGQGFTRICLLPQAIANFARQRQQQGVLTDLEVERLDRIRNPEKYRGK